MVVVMMMIMIFLDSFSCCNFVFAITQFVYSFIFMTFLLILLQVVTF